MVAAQHYRVDCYIDYCWALTGKDFNSEACPRYNKPRYKIYMEEPELWLSSTYPPSTRDDSRRPANGSKTSVGR